MHHLVVPLVVAAITLIAGPAPGAEFTITGLHMCCKTCARTVEDTLDLDGVTEVNVDRSARSVLIKADTPNDALKALAAAGFHGNVEGHEHPLKNSLSDQPATSLKLSGLHLCCGQCQRVLVGAIRKVPNVSTVEIEDRVVTITAAQGGVRPRDVLEAAHRAGFHGEVLPAGPAGPAGR